MPTLNWIGKDKVITHHQDVPFRVLEHKYSFGEENDITVAGNKIIHGDNLEGLKALLPEYEGKIKCIYIDPPYNTGKENWVYNDNVNDPKIKKWLGQVVGKEAEDLTRHDKWLCMMYPRLKLLHQLLAQDGAIFISIDDNEQANLKLIMDEIFGKNNFITNFTWTTDGNSDNQGKIKVVHEYILFYFKNCSLFDAPMVVDPNIAVKSKLYKNEIRNTVVKNGPKNPVSQLTLPIGFPADVDELEIKARKTSWPHYYTKALIKNYALQNEVIVESGWSSKKILLDFIKSNFLPVKDTKNQNTIFTLTKNGTIENIKIRDNPSHVLSSLRNLGSTQKMSAELEKMGIVFNYPKPTDLIEYLISIVCKKDSIILDSFAGSGTTAHAVLNLNKDGGNRKFIIIEMDDYAENITAERVRRVINGYGDIAGTGGGFAYYELGQAVFTPTHELNETIGEDKIRSYIYYSETRQPLTRLRDNADDYLLDNFQNTAYYFYYLPDQLTTLDLKALKLVTYVSEQYVIYADNCLLDKDFMRTNKIIFKKIPRDIKRF